MYIYTAVAIVPYIRGRSYIYIKQLLLYPIIALRSYEVPTKHAPNKDMNPIQLHITYVCYSPYNSTNCKYGKCETLEYLNGTDTV